MKIKKMPKPYTHQWEKLANELARDAAPDIIPCVHCDSPVLSGYCCTNCGSSDPRTKEII